MRSLSFCIALLFLALASVAQATLYSVTVHTGANLEGHRVAKDSSTGNLYILGSIWDNPSIQSQIILTFTPDSKYNVQVWPGVSFGPNDSIQVSSSNVGASVGNLFIATDLSGFHKWTKTPEYAGDGSWSLAGGVAADHSGGFFLSSSIYKQKETSPSGPVAYKNYAALTHVLVDGSVSGALYFRNSPFSEDRGGPILPLQGNDFIFQTYSPEGTVAHYFSNLTNNTWSLSIPYAPFVGTADSASIDLKSAQVFGGNLFLVGTVNYYVNSKPAGSKVVVFCLNPSTGQPIWVKTYGNGHEEVAGAVLLDDGLLILGTSVGEKNLLFDFFLNPNGVGEAAYLVRTDYYEDAGQALGTGVAEGVVIGTSKFDSENWYHTDILNLDSSTIYDGDCLEEITFPETSIQTSQTAFHAVWAIDTGVYFKDLVLEPTSPDLTFKKTVCEAGDHPSIFKEATTWWYDPEFPGTGVALEIQNSKAFLAWFTYDSSGRTTWYTASGNISAGHLDTDLLEWHGWPLGAPYSAPSPTPVGRLIVNLTNGQMSFDATVGSHHVVKTLKPFMKDYSPGPEDSRHLTGWWYDPSYNGMGFYLAAYGGKMAMVWYNYREDGTPRWWTSTGNFPDGSTEYYGSLDGWHGGECPGCLFSLPVRDAGAGGAISILFGTKGVDAMTNYGEFLLEKFSF